MKDDSAIGKNLKEVWLSTNVYVIAYGCLVVLVETTSFIMRVHGTYTSIYALSASSRPLILIVRMIHIVVRDLRDAVLLLSLRNKS
jgi:hypothetical protein